MSGLARLYYLAGSTVASATADSVHVVRMCDALRAHVEDLVLYAKAGERADVDGYYGLSRPLPCELVPFSGRRDLLRYVIRLLRAPRPDLAFGRYVYPLAWMVARGVPSMVEIHAPASGVKRRVEDWLLGRESMLGVVFITAALRDHYLQRYPDLAGRNLVLADAADDPGDALLPKETGTLSVGYAGSWFAGRGIELIVTLAEQLPHIEFRLAGGSAEDLRRMGLPLPPNVTCLGYLPPATVPAELRGADVLLAPYARVVRLAGDSGDTSAWCSPMKVFEYMAQGKAIVCADLPVLREVLTPDVNCLLPEPENLDAWRDALLRLDGDRNLARRLGARARQDFLDRHTWSDRASKVVDYARARLG